MAIKSLKEVSEEAFISLKKYQDGEFQPVKTGREWLDDIFGGLLPADIVTISGASGGGKSFELQRIKNFVMNTINNVNADKFIWLDNSLEMRLISNMIRDMTTLLGKSKKRVLTENYSEEERLLVKDYRKNMRDGRFFINEEAVSSIQFEKETCEFLEQHKEKDAVFISLDHIALQKSQSGDKKSTVDDIVESINRMKKKYPNSYWIILSQLNREVLKRIKDKDMCALPNRGDVFQSDSMFFISDYLYVCHNPYRLGINKFLKVGTAFYDYLEPHFCDVKEGKASFTTLGKMFYIVLKSREAGVVFNDIFIEDVPISEELKAKIKKDQEVTTATPTFEIKTAMPIFDMEHANTTLNKIAGEGFDPFN